MAYKSIIEMAQSQSLRMRIVACAAREGIDSPETWVTSRMWQLAATVGWDDDWQYAKATANANVNPDTGARDDVINDADILSRVQEIVVAEGGGA